jgi:hypothetical protein
MAVNDNTKALAAKNGSLSVITTSGPWTIYQVKDAPLVQGLANQPAVITGQPTTGRPWQDTAVCWWSDPDSWDVVLTADGPPGWQRVSRTNQPDESAMPQRQCEPTGGWQWLDDSGGPTATAQPPVQVTNIVETDDGLSFDVDRTGVPVVVKASYFPNWQASGAEGPYRAVPNLMVVVPTANHVELHYGYTGLDLASYAVTALGIVALVLLFRARPVRVKPPRRFWGRAERPDLYPPRTGSRSAARAAESGRPAPAPGYDQQRAAALAAILPPSSPGPEPDAGWPPVSPQDPVHPPAYGRPTAPDAPVWRDTADDGAPRGSNGQDEPDRSAGPDGSAGPSGIGGPDGR